MAKIDLTKVICTGTATMVTYGGRNFIKNVSGFALCGLYYNGSWKGPIVISPTQSVSCYTTSGNYSSTNNSTAYVTVNGIKWWYTPGNAWYQGNWSPGGGSYTYYFGQYANQAAAATSIVNNFYDSVSEISWSINSNEGSISSSGGFYTGYELYWSNQHNITLMINPVLGRTPIGWYINNQKISGDNPYIIDTTSSVTNLIAKTAVAGQAIIL